MVLQIPEGFWEYRLGFVISWREKGIPERKWGFLKGFGSSCRKHGILSSFPVCFEFSWNNQQVGAYKFNHNALCHFWQDVPSDPNGFVTLNNMIYNFRRIPTGIRSLQFKKETWGHFKFRLYAVRGDAYAEYTFRMEQLNWIRSGFVNHHPFTGAIETNSKNILVVVAAFYLVERVFETLEETDAIQ
jgi:hypothetical protein